MDEEIYQLARQAALLGAKVLKSMWNQGVGVQAKAAADFVTEADKASEAAILDFLGRQTPKAEYLAEESAAGDFRAPAGSGLTWIIDPLDGTTNFIHRIPHVAVSVAAYLDGAPAAGVVLDVTRQEEFSAAAGRGAWLDGNAIRVSRETDRGRSLLLTGFPFRDKERLERFLKLFGEVFSQVAGVRRAGSAALDLAWVAAGRAEGFWETTLAPWDTAAGALIVREAGGLVTDYDGGDQAVWRGDVVAASPRVHPWLQGLCGREFPGG